MSNITDSETIISGQLLSEDSNNEFSLRPDTLADYIGQRDLIENLTVFMDAAKIRNEAMDHILLCGPPGLGKTTLANIIANKMGTNLYSTSGPALEKKGDLAGILTNLQKGDFIFIDEIHRLPYIIEENLYPAMEDFKFHVVVGEGAHARTIELDLKPFTIIGATTKSGLLTRPLRDRFGYTARLNYYSVTELKEILLKSAMKLKVQLTDDGALEIAKRSRCTPRIANRLLKRVRDFAYVMNNAQIDISTAKHALNKLGVDHLGLSQMDVKLLKALVYTFRGRAIGLETLGAALGEETSTIEDVYEPYLLQEGLLVRTPKGRMATRKAHQHLLQ